jgi:hypothetical protein
MTSTAVPRTGLPWSWGVTELERRARYPCAELVAEPAARMVRGIDVAAPAAIVYRWLCQLTLAPYSYDLLDNGGRRSPRALTPGVERLQVGAPLLKIFQIAEFEPGRELTGVGAPGPTRRFGPMACTYRVLPTADGSSRLLGRLDITARRRTVTMLIAWGDLVMMRKQLRTLRRLAEHQHRRAAPT